MDQSIYSVKHKLAVFLLLLGPITAFVGCSAGRPLSQSAVTLLAVDKAQFAPIGALRIGELSGSGPELSEDHIRQSLLAAIDQHTNFVVEPGGVLDEDLAQISCLVDPYQERDGSEFGGVSPAVVGITCQITRAEQLLWKASYFHRSEALSQNLLRLGAVLSEGAGWRSREELLRGGFALLLTRAEQDRTGPLAAR